MSRHWFKLMQKIKLFIMVECQLINVGVMGLGKSPLGIHYSGDELRKTHSLKQSPVNTFRDFLSSPWLRLRPM